MTLGDLSQQVGNMMHMMNQVRVIQRQDRQAAKDDDSAPCCDEVAMYDIPRNVHGAPLRDERTGKDDNGQDVDNTESLQKVWDTFLSPKTQRVGAHSYFVIPTEKQTR